MNVVPRQLIRMLVLIGGTYAAACGYLFLAQRSYLYFPTSRSPEVPSMVLGRDDASIVVSVNASPSDSAVVYFGGNAEDVSQTIAHLEAVFPTIRIYAMHYRGYGGSTGSPSEAALVADAQALFDHVDASHDSIVVIGRSLGTGIAVQVAASRHIERLVLITPYDSIVSVAAGHFGAFPTSLLLRDRYESWRYADRIRAPTTLIVAGKDRVIPKHHALKLAESFRAATPILVLIEHADHDDVSDHPDYVAALRSEMP